MMFQIYKFKKIITNFVIAPLTMYSAYQVADAYKISKTPSSFSVAAKQFNFNTNEEQEAFLNILYLAGYLKPEQVWQDLNRMGKIENATKLFPHLKHVLIKAGANQDDPAKFNPTYLRKVWLRGLDVEDAKDLMLYEAQHAFNRKVSQERNELKEQSWMNKHRDLYLTSAKDAGLVDRIEPKHQQYDEAWIAGASRVGVLARLIDFKYIIDSKKIKIKDDIYILAGERELWAEIDGITPEVYHKLVRAQGTNIDHLDVSVNVGDNYACNIEGMSYLSELAKKLNISLDPDKPFVQCVQGECPAGRFPGRTYANYATKDSVKLTESKMAEDLKSTFFSGKNEMVGKISIIDTFAEGSSRPTTATTTRDAVEKLVVNIQDGKYGDQKHFEILFESNNPYIRRQALVAQREVSEVLHKHGLDKQGYTIKIEGIGFCFKQDVATIHSEFGALIAEEWRNTTNNKRDIQDLLYQTRNTNIIVDDAHDSETGMLGELKLSLVDWFDEL